MSVPILQDWEISTAEATTTPTVNKPTGTVEGDLLVIFLGTDSGTPRILGVGSTGFTELGSDVDHTNSMVAYKIATGSEPSTYGFTVSVSESTVMWCGRIDGQHASAFMDAWSSSSSGVSAAPISPDVTTTVDDCLVFRFFVIDRDGITTDTGYPSGTTGVAVRAAPGAGTSCSGGIAHESQISAGVTGTATWTVDNSDGWHGWTVTIAPAAAAVTDQPAAMMLGL